MLLGKNGEFVSIYGIVEAFRGAERKHEVCEGSSVPQPDDAEDEGGDHEEEERREGGEVRTEAIVHQGHDHFNPAELHNFWPRRKVFQITPITNSLNESVHQIPVIN